MCLQVEKLDIKTKTWLETGLMDDPVNASQFGATAIPANLHP